MDDAFGGLLEPPPMARLNDLDRAKVRRLFVEKSFPARRALYWAGDASPGIWMVASGFLKLVRSSREGEDLLMSLVGPGDLFGPCCDPFGFSPAPCTASTQSAARLLHGLARWSKSTARPVELPRLLTHAEMANAVGTAREVITRCLARLEEQGLIRRRGRRILLPDPEALAPGEA